MARRESGGSGCKYLMMGCGAVIGVAVLGVVVLFVLAAMGPEGGVRMNNDMEEYATKYLEEHKVLEAGEEVVAYYDKTMSMDGTEAIILSSSRLIHHKSGKNLAVPLTDIVNINHREDGALGDVFEIEYKGGKFLKFEIDLWNGGETFKNALLRSWELAKAKTPKAGSTTPKQPAKAETPKPPATP